MRQFRKFIWTFLVMTTTICQLFSNAVYAKSIDEYSTLVIETVGSGSVKVIENGQEHDVADKMELSILKNSEVKFLVSTENGVIEDFKVNEERINGFCENQSKQELSYNLNEDRVSVFIKFSESLVTENPVSEAVEEVYDDTEMFDGVAGGNHYYSQEEIARNEMIASSWLSNNVSVLDQRNTKGFSVVELSYHTWINKLGSLNNGLWKLSSGTISFCIEGLNASPHVGDATSSSYEVDNANLRKALYYGYGGPGDVLTSTYGVSGSVVITDDISSYAYCGTSIGATLANGYHWNNGLSAIYNQIMSYPDPKEYGFSAYVVDVDGSGSNWQGQPSRKQKLGFIDRSPYGKLQLQKSSANTSISENNNYYSLAGAEYGLYTDASTTNKVGSFTIGEDGKSNVIDKLTVQTYYIKETKAPNGYALDTRVYQATVESDKTVLIDVEDIPQSDPIGILLRKSDSQSNDIPQGNASLKDAEFTVKFYAGNYKDGLDPTKDGVSPSRKWIFKTDEKGLVNFNSDYLVSGDDFYYNSESKPTLPLGTLTIQETKAPNGYIKNDEVFVRRITSDSNVESVLTYNAPVIPNNVIKGKFSIRKVITDGNQSEIVKPEKDAEFMAVLKTYVEKYGSVEEAIKHKEEFNDSEWDILKTNSKGNATSKELSFGTYVVKQTALGNKDTEILNETFEFEVNKDKQEIIEYTINNRPVGYYVGILKKDKESGKLVTFNSAEFKIKDENGKYVRQKVGGKYYDTFRTTAKNESKLPQGTFYVENGEQGTVITPLKLKAGKYTIEEVSTPEGFLNLEAPIEVVLGKVVVTHTDEDGDQYVVVEALNAQPKGKIIISKTDKETKNPMSDVEYELRVKENIVDMITGKTLYKKGQEVGKGFTNKDGKLEFSNLYMGEYVLKETLTNDGYVLDTKEHDVIFKAEDISTKEYIQSFEFENIHPIGQIHLTKLDQDTKEYLSGVTFELTTKEDIYSLDGRKTLIYKKGDKVSKDISQDGRYVTNELGEIHISDLPLGKYLLKEIDTLDNYILDEKEFEIDLSYDESDKVIYVSELDVFNEKISISTTAFNELTDDKYFNNKNKITVVDKVTYKGLRVNQEYELKGTLMDKETNEPVLVDGKQIESSLSFTPKKTDGYVEMEFILDASLLGGKDIVVFEKLYSKKTGNCIALHEDIENKDQTIHINDVKIDTKAYSFDTKTNIVNQSKHTTIKDKVSYENLVPNLKYSMKGILMDKSTSKPLLIDGKTITSTLDFVSETSNGEVEMTFKLDTTGLERKEIVVYEQLEIDGILVGKHEDINDKDQTIKVSSVPPTSTETNMKSYLLMASCALFAISLLVIRRSKQLFR